MHSPGGWGGATDLYKQYALTTIVLRVDGCGKRGGTLVLFRPGHHAGQRAGAAVTGPVPGAAGGGVTGPSRTPMSSTSNTRVAFGGMSGGLPFSPYAIWYG